MGSFIFFQEESVIFISLGALVFSLIGALLVSTFKKQVSTDSAMTLVLSGFFGFGVLISSIIQQMMPKYYRLASGYLFGQVSTMTDTHIVVYAIACLVCITFLCFFFHRINLNLFDHEQSVLIGDNKISFMLNFLMAFSIILGIRGIGVVLVSSFFVAPAIIGKKWAKTFLGVLCSSTLFSMVITGASFYFFSKWPMGPTVVILLSMTALVFLPKVQHTKAVVD